MSPVLGPYPTRLSKGQTLGRILGTWFRTSFGALAPGYAAP